MEDDDMFKLLETCIDSYAPVKSDISACFQSITKQHITGKKDFYTIYSMARLEGSMFIMNSGAEGDSYGNNGNNILNIKTMTAYRLAARFRKLYAYFNSGLLSLVLEDVRPFVILGGQSQKIGEIDFRARQEVCKNDQKIRGRYEKQVGQTIYAVDYYRSLYLIEWQDIRDSKYQKILIKIDVENFYVDEQIGLAIINIDGTLSLPDGTRVNLKKNADPKAQWTLLTNIAKYWIVSGDLDNQSVIASIDKNGKFKSRLKINLTSNGHLDYHDGHKFAGIFTLHQAYARGRRGIMMVIERDGCCHLISVMYGRMAMLQSIDSIVMPRSIPVEILEDQDEEERFDGISMYTQQNIVHFVTDTGIEGEFVAGGHSWTKKKRVKLK